MSSGLRGWPGIPASVLLTLLMAHAVPASQNQETDRATSFTPEEEVRRGQEAASGLRLLLPPIADPEVTGVVTDIGKQLAAAIPAERRQPAFRYSFSVVNVSNLVSYALSGGPVIVSRGMIEAATSDTQLAGLLAHQVAHVVLRHGTIQASRGQAFARADLVEQTLGSITVRTEETLGLPGATFGISTYYLEYAPALEVEANRLAERIMAGAGYDPRGVGDMLRLIITAGTDKGGVAWARSHPNPETAADAAAQDGGSVPAPAAAARAASFDRFRSIQSRLMAMPPAPASYEAARAQGNRFIGDPVGEVNPPAGESRRVLVGNVVQVDVPASWRRLFGTTSMMFAPEGGFFETDAELIGMTHGMQIGVARSPTGNLEQDTLALLRRLAETNAQVTWTPVLQRIRLDGRTALTVVANSVSVATGRFKYMSVSTTRLRDGSLLYFIGVAPRLEASTYRRAFDRVEQSVRFVD